MIALLFLWACAPLAGSWSGEAECAGYSLPIEVELEASEGAYVGWGALYCEALTGEDCIQSFVIDVEPEGGFGRQDLDVDVDDCELHTLDGPEPLACENPDDLDWDGADEIEGEWNGCDVELERD